MREPRCPVRWTAGLFVAAQLSIAFPAQAQRLGGGQPLEVSLGRIVIALLISLIVAGLAILLIRQRGGRIDLAGWFGRFHVRERAIEVVETRRLSQHADICLVRHRGSEFLLLLTAADARVLSEGRAPAAIGEKPQP